MIIIMLLISISLHALSLQEVYDNADSFGEYDKYLILSSDTIYTGGLGLYEGKTFIDCNGSIINLQDGNGIWVYGDENNTTNLDIQECIITNSLYFGLSYSGESNGNIINCNLVNTNFGLKLFDNANISVNNSIFSSNNSMGIAIYTENPILNISYSLFWNNEDNHLENCPGWGNIWTQFELDPGFGIIYSDPLFIDFNHWDFNINSDSPCINSGDPLMYDLDGSISDIGALKFNLNCSNFGDLNNDNDINILDIINLVNCILYEECNVCSDLNYDGIYNLLDIINLVNFILN